MNWSKGLWRVWLSAALLWGAVIAAFAAADLHGHHPFAGLYAYSDARDAFLPQHYAADEAVVEDGVRRGVVARTDFPDGTSLAAPPDLGEERVRQIAERFWAERWARRAEVLWPWGLGATVPPLVLLLSGALILWIARGFGRANAAPETAMEETAVPEKAEGDAPKAAFNTRSAGGLPPFIRSLGPDPKRRRVLGEGR
ncbi:hypothetical protein D9623_32540 [Azospirillum brasilense]|uniref:Uncharacterized protein n=1 Tax=Azospirillum brasilense TaxID=192 RepID=A0A0P0F709_AZOBR|nr:MULTISPECIES: hypothetical protein [Azospirillum]ALJ38881.1 hypothetical protein AMK58_25615 [Azospirillum brasilense]MDW7557080.1 hypothetical protein [Azospirillum brasilense]MDW7596756.1 hypothetical protein [Azospirillum brasilense]MDW7631880.1 hypothetical protein [Azospirillum brasilense]MDX5950729.1 hypothetical protein [Azospirillum brasilense]